jgi:hypothetical protein
VSPEKEYQRGYASRVRGELLVIGVSIASLIVFTTAAGSMGISSNLSSCGCAVAGKELPDNFLIGPLIMIINCFQMDYRSPIVPPRNISPPKITYG